MNVAAAKTRLIFADNMLEVCINPTELLKARLQQMAPRHTYSYNVQSDYTISLMTCKSSIIFYKLYEHVTKHFVTFKL